MKAYTINNETSTINDFKGFTHYHRGFLHGDFHALIYANSLDEAYEYLYGIDKEMLNIILNDIKKSIDRSLDNVDFSINLIEIIPNVWGMYSGGYINVDMASYAIESLHNYGEINSFYEITFDKVVEAIRRQLHKKSEVDCSMNDFVPNKCILQSMQAAFGAQFLVSNTPGNIFAQAYKEAILSVSTKKEYSIPNANTVGTVWNAIKERGIAIV